MFSPRTRLLMGLLGALLFALLVWRIGPRELADNLIQVGWGFLWIFGLGGLSHVVKTWAWRFTLPRGHRSVSFRRMLAVRIAGEGVSQLVVAGQLIGETTRAWMIRTALPTSGGVSSVVLDRTMYSLTALLVAIGGSIAAALSIGIPGKRALPGVAAVVLMGLAFLVGAWLFGRRRGVLSRLLRRLERWGTMGHWLAQRRKPIEEVEENIAFFVHDDRASFLGSLVLNLLGHALSVLEVFLILRLLGVQVTLFDSFCIEGLTKLINLGGIIIPGNLGASEAGNVAVLSGLGLGAESGLTLAITRRLRGLSWAVVGLMILYIEGSRLRKPVRTE